MHWLSMTVQLVGTVVTGIGLLYAYGRATRLRAQLRGWWDRVRRKPINATVNATLPGMQMSMYGDVHMPFALDENATTEEKFAQIQGYVRELRAMFGPINAAIARLEKEIEQAKEHADAVAARALTDAKNELQRFDTRLNEVQAVDLRIAAVGAFITAAGCVLSYFSGLRY
ncbi:hypothetical protein [Mycobacterium arosiense]|uniref:Uncharacterized protein n=1 Tax=Mycobacterium arosiense ATCC BAA-1401 = DSM 45069 TaxID=1265311 RepID=A0A1W9Z5Y0_MYCAI|nr:hypothetical protein [Mycobacterium arosiense]ORA07758.1 hypothetical protein BST14_26415 [Mycobacterium arosiense ATCC BAA-1401 = DSM 45069]